MLSFDLAVISWLKLCSVPLATGAKVSCAAKVRIYRIGMALDVHLTLKNGYPQAILLSPLHIIIISNWPEMSVLVSRKH